MPVEEIDLVEEILGPVVAAQWTASQPDMSSSAEDVDAPLVRDRSVTGRRGWVIGLALAFTLGAMACLALLAAVALAAFSADANRVVAGVRIGSVDLSGLSRDQVVARLTATYAYLGQGEVTVTTPAGTATITYQQLGRAPDVQFMADEAMRIGHSGGPIGDAVAILRTALSGR